MESRSTKSDSLNMAAPAIERHERFDVAREDVLIGGTKSRYLGALFDEADEVVYASPVQGAAQIALAAKASDLKKRATIFCARRQKRHKNTAAAAAFGAEIREVSFGMLSNVQHQAGVYVENAWKRWDGQTTLAPFGLRIPEAIACLREACSSIHDAYDEVWCAAGSGTLAEALSVAFPTARIFAVSVGHKIAPGEAGRAKVLKYDRPFDKPAREVPPFPCNMTFDAKAWEMMKMISHAKRVLFWNVDRDHG